MTVIATDGKTIASDSQETGAYTERCAKLYRLNDGRIAGTTGDSGLSLKMIRYLNGEISADEWYYTWGGYGDASLILVGTMRWTGEDSSQGSEEGCWILDSDSLEEIPARLPAAVGSGSLLAMGAMEEGKSPKQAVKIAIKRDPYCGGPVVVKKI